MRRFSLARSFLVSLLLALVVGAMTSTSAAQLVELDDRPFLLVSAPHRFTPTERPVVHVQKRSGGTISVAWFRVTDPARALGWVGDEGTSTAQSRVGAEAERLLRATGSLPRSGRELTLLSNRRMELEEPAPRERVHDESEAYDSVDDEEVATGWMENEAWATRDVRFPRARPGLYLVQVRSAAYVSSALVSVGELVMVVRRGDDRDLVRVTDSRGRPREGVTVRAEGRPSETTNDQGVAWFSATDALRSRYVATAGSDYAFSDVDHTRLSACDPTIYLGTGRPTYRFDETVHLRGHIRGCRDGRRSALSGEEIHAGDETVRSDSRGNFVVEVPVGRTLEVTHEGERHVRTVHIDERTLPRRGLTVASDRPYVRSGDLVRLSAYDDEGGWPVRHEVIFNTPVGRLIGNAGPGRPATVSFRAPASGELRRFPITASLADGAVTTAYTELWVGRTNTVVDLQVEDADADEDAELPFSVAVRALDGSIQDGSATVRVFATDGNEEQGEERARQTVSLVAGEAAGRVRLAGAGPWFVEVKVGDATDRQVVWSRGGGPLPLSSRGPLAIAVDTTTVAPGSQVAVRTRAPRGRSIVTLERNGVRWLGNVERSAVRDRATSMQVRIPADAEGAMTLVITNVHQGKVTTASATLRVETRPTMFTMTRERSVFAGGERMKVRLRGRTGDRAARGAATVWLADAGYWDLNEDDHPGPADFLRATGRPATHGDSSRPLLFGAEEGRVLPGAFVAWAGERLPRATYRHGWSYGGEVIRFRGRGTTRELLQGFARAARLRLGEVCIREETTERSRAAVIDLPWDLALERLADKLGLNPYFEEGVLSFSCDMGASGLGGLGRGAGGAQIRSGRASVTGLRQSRLYGTQHVIPNVVLDANGEAEVELPLPSHPGRWRVEALLVTDEGGGGRAHVIAQTREPIETYAEAPERLKQGDRVEAIVHINAPTYRGRPVQYTLTTSMGLVPDRARGQVQLDDFGRARVPVALRATEVGDAFVNVRVATGTATGADEDASRLTLHVEARERAAPISRRALISSQRARVTIPLTGIAKPSLLEVTLAPRLDEQMGELLEAFRAPRWDFPISRVARLHSLGLLRNVAARLPRDRGTLIVPQIDEAIASDVRGLGRAQLANGGVPVFWGARAHGVMSARMYQALPDAVKRQERWVGTLDHAIAEARRGNLHAEAEAIFAPYVERRDGALADLMLRRASRRVISSMDIARQVAHSAVALGEPETVTLALRAVTRHVEAGLGTDPNQCAGFWLCGDRHRVGEVARGVLTLLTLAPGRHDALASRAVDWLASWGGRDPTRMWGTTEADLFALRAHLGRSRSRAGRVEVRVDGERRRIVNGQIEVGPGDEAVVVAVSESREARLTSLRITGELVIEDHAPSGAIAVTRQFLGPPSAPRVDVEFDVPRSAQGRVEVMVPLPAGLRRSGEVEGFVHEDVRDGVRLTARTDLRGPIHVSIPLTRVNRGTFFAGGATVLVGDGGFGASASTIVEE